MVLASYVPVMPLLAQHGCRILIISTSTPRYSSSFAHGLGFELPGAVAIDTKRVTHRAAKLKASVYASLVMPFRKHLATFGGRAVIEALRVSLLNATPGHGSSWQQGATFVLRRDAGSGGGGGGATGGAAPDAPVRCVWAWREDYPGDWQPVHRVLAEGVGIPGAPEVSFPERLEFVIACRNQRKASSSGAASSAEEAACGSSEAEAGRSKQREGSPKKRGRRAVESEECDDEACSVGAVRQRAAAAMARSDADAADPNAI